MPRSPRIHYPGAVYHAMARGVDGRTTFIDEHDYARFLTTLRTVATEGGANVLAHCLMPNHFHVAIKVTRIPLSILMHRLLTSHSITFNLRHERTGHLFQARYKAVLCRDDAYLTALVRYIHNNPVRAGLANDAGSWKWSSFAAYLASGRDGHVETTQDLPELDPSDDRDFEPWPKPERSPLLLRGEDAASRTLDALAARAAGGYSREILRSCTRRRDITALRRVFVQSAYREGHPLVAIASWLDVTVNAVKHYLPANNCNNCKPDP